ncbi:hypothetical protein EWB00_003245 [Schistosoma japonicum]|nr:hypothetical protein EWB00_003245 [Schistosoma japonicum]
MERSLEIMFIILLVMINTDYSMSASCFTCFPCPDPFNPSDRRITNRTDCNWCASIYPKGFKVPIRECVPVCKTDVWSDIYNSFSYSCCNQDYCNKSVQTRTTHQILLNMVSALSCFFIIRCK